MKVFHHIYNTEEGRRIAEEQDHVCISVGLTDITKGVSDPSDVHQLYEGATLQKLWEWAKETTDKYVCYIHTKGASLPTIERRKSYQDWRLSMEAVVLHRWEDCIDALETCDCYGAHLPTDDRYFFPGNFWWSKTSHIQTLPSPIEWAEKICGRKGTDVRYGYEDWVTLSRPGVIAKAMFPWKP
jgi:hypothetical protein